VNKAGSVRCSRFCFQVAQIISLRLKCTSSSIIDPLMYRHLSWSTDVSLSCFQRRPNPMRRSCVPWSLRELLPSQTFVPPACIIKQSYIIDIGTESSSSMLQKLFNIRIGLVARICRSQSSQGDQFRQGRGSIPRFGIIPFSFAPG
jgi:hypothetical protein